LLDESMGTYGNGSLTVSERLAGGGALFGLRAASKQNDMQAEGGEQSAQAAVVLLGQNLGGGEQRPLVAIGGAGHERSSGHRRLTGADVALEQADHRARPGEVGQNLANGPALGGGKAEGQTALE